MLRVLALIQQAKQQKAKKLDLEGIGIDEIPQEIFELHELEELNIAYNFIESISVAMQQWQSLKLLDLRGNRLEALPDRPGLYLTSGQYQKFKPAVEHVTGLQFSRSDHVEADEILSMPNLSIINLQSYGHLPHWLSQLQGITHLDISWNYLHTLPEFLGQFSRLSYLDISWNKRLPAISEFLLCLSDNCHRTHVKLKHQFPYFSAGCRLYRCS